MTKTRQILKAMIADGKPRTNELLRKEFGLTSPQASCVLRALAKSRYITAAPITYTLSDKGRQCIESRTEEHTEKLKKKAAYVARRRAVERGEQVPTVSTQTIVRSALQSRPALDMAWGGARQGAEA